MSKVYTHNKTFIILTTLMLASCLSEQKMHDADVIDSFRNIPAEAEKSTYKQKVDKFIDKLKKQKGWKLVYSDDDYESYEIKINGTLIKVNYFLFCNEVEVEIGDSKIITGKYKGRIKDLVDAVKKRNMEKKEVEKEKLIDKILEE